MARKKSGSAWWGAMLVIIVASFALGCDKPGEGNHKAEVHEDAPPHAAARGRREAEPGTVKPAALKPPAVKPDVEPSPTLEKQLMKQQEEAALRSRDGWKEFDALCLSAEKLEERALHTKKSDGLDEALHLRQGALRKLEELRNLEEECYHRANKLHELRVYEDALMNLGRDPQVYLDGLKEIREVQAMVRERMKKVDHIMGEAELAGTLARKGAGLKPPDSFFSDVAKCHQFLDELAELAEDVRQKQARLKARVRKNKSLIQESAKVLARGYVLQEKVVARTERCPRCEGSGRVFRYHVGRGKTREYPASRTQGPPTTNTARCSKCGGKGFLRAGTRKVKVKKRLDGITIGRIRKRLSILKRTVAREEAELKVLEDAANIVQEGTLKISVALAEGNQVPQRKELSAEELARVSSPFLVTREVPGDKLIAGRRYRIYAEFNLMPMHTNDFARLDPKQLGLVWKRIRKIEKERTGLACRVVEVRASRQGTPWYKIRYGQTQGWVNSVALMSAKIEDLSR